jgi:endonuclease-3
MNDDPEPSENIAGDMAAADHPETFRSGDADSKAEAVVDRLGHRYWRKSYGGQAAFECLVRTVLSQNTSDKASQPAFDALLEQFNDPDLAEALAGAEVDDIADTIRPAGLYNQKAQTLIRLAERVRHDHGGAAGFDAFVKGSARTTVRESLLDMHGVGPKTADCILLFSGGQASVFPVDTHVYRISRRLGIAPPDADHETVREALEAAVPAEKCGFGHTACIQFGRDVCTARNPACLDGPAACPLYDLCDRIGIDESAGEVRDPAEVNP